MLKNLLLHLEGTPQSKPVIRFGVELAGRTGARVRGLTLLDTRWSERAQFCETAAYSMLEDSRRSRVESQHHSVRSELSRACLDAHLDFDLRRLHGDPLMLLPRECRFHDLAITCLDRRRQRTNKSSEFSVQDLLELLQRGVQPLLLLDPQCPRIERVLLVYDGGEPSARAIRSYLNLDIFPEATHRLLALGKSEEASRQALCEMGDYCSQRMPTIELGRMCGRAGKLLWPFAQQWQADLIVYGVTGNRLLSRLPGNITFTLLKRFGGCLYLST